MFNAVGGSDRWLKLLERGGAVMCNAGLEIRDLQAARYQLGSCLAVTSVKVVENRR